MGWDNDGKFYHDIVTHSSSHAADVSCKDVINNKRQNLKFFFSLKASSLGLMD
jgi:hypothetical protein